MNERGTDKNIEKEVYKRRFVETTNFPIDLVNDKSGGEKQSGGRPPYWEMVFWWTRKPLVGARSVIAASLLPEDIDIKEFIRAMKLDKKTPHRLNPDIPKKWKKYIEGKKLLDPFSGFGSIPLEGLRLGLNVTASELLPTAYIFLKAVLEYPLKYGNKLMKDVKKWGEWIIQKLKEDKDIRELYDENVVAYIGTWEVKCPHCDKWTPLIGNWWLARVKDNKKKYRRLAYMDYEKSNDKIEIKVVDVNKDVSVNIKGKLRDIIANAKVDVKKGEIVVDRKIYKVPSSNIIPGKLATCLNCGNPIKFVDGNGNHYTNKEDIAKNKRNALEWYVKWALKKYHEGNNSSARQRLLVKVKIENGDFVFEPCDENDNVKLMLAKEKINELENRGDVDIPNELIPLYGNIGGGGHFLPLNYGMIHWKDLFNPRQLFIHVKLVKLIRDVGKKVEEEEIRAGKSNEEAMRYAECVATYLSIGLLKYADYNFLCNLWDSNIPKISHGLTMRGISMMWNWVDENPLERFVGSWTKVLDYSLQNSLKYLISSRKGFNNTLSNSIKENDYFSEKILLEDATSLSKVNDKFDVIVTDPPYADDVPYVELSDFYYVWLKRALSCVKEGKLVPRFHHSAFFKKIGNKYIEIKTQWQEFAKREVSTKSGRFLDTDNHYRRAEEHFQNLLTQAFIAMREHLKEDGLLITYYAHTSPKAWASLLEAGWKGAKATITNAFPLATESAQRVTGKGKLVLDTSVVVIWRIETQKKERNIIDLKEEIIEATKNRANELIEQGYVGRDVLIGAMASALNIVTRYRGVYDGEGNLEVDKLLIKYVYPFTAVGITDALKEMAKVGEIKSPESLFYLLVKALFGTKQREENKKESKNGKKIFKKMNRNDVTLLKISTRVDTTKLLNDSILKKKKEEYLLQEPSSSDSSVLERFLKEERKINLANPKIRNSIDALHLMEYYSLIFPLSKLKDRWEEIKNEYPIEAEEAVTLAKILHQILPKGDPEKELARNFVERIEEENLEKYISPPDTKKGSLID